MPEISERSNTLTVMERRAPQAKEMGAQQNHELQFAIMGRCAIDLVGKSYLDNVCKDYFLRGWMVSIRKQNFKESPAFTIRHHSGSWTSCTYRKPVLSSSLGVHAPHGRHQLEARHYRRHWRQLALPLVQKSRVSI